MLKKRVLIALTLLIFSFLNIANKVFAQDTLPTAKYPDYAKEFIGNDPWESFNRKAFAIDLKLNKYILRPINILWCSVLPQYAIDRVRNFYTNLNYPTRLVGCLLQEDYHSSKTETIRFLTNTTIGFIGLYDPASSVFKIEPRKEDIEQALAYHKFKKGPYLIVPSIGQGSIRDWVGKFLDAPFDITSYIVGPVSTVSTGVSKLNDSTYWQPIFKMADNYADPYVPAKELWGIDKYIKNNNIDRVNIYDNQQQPENILPVNTKDTNSLIADIQLDDYNPQGPAVDAMRSILFDYQNLNDSIWPEISLWNKSFLKQIKTSSVEIYPTRAKYKYRYILQSNINAPVAIIYPSIGESIHSCDSTILAKILYDEGYSVVLQGSAFQWEFVKSMPDNYKPGLPVQDAYYSRVTTAKILADISEKKECTFNTKIIVGSSFGAVTSLFAAAEEEKDNTLGISKYIAINPPVQMFYALQQLDKYSQDWQNSPEDIKLRAASTVRKVNTLSQMVANKKTKASIKTLPFNNDEAELAICFVIKQKLSDVIFTIENTSKCNTIAEKTAFYNMVNNLDFYGYVQKYILPYQKKTINQLDYESSLYALSKYLKDNDNYIIYHSIDDCFTNPRQLKWLKRTTGGKSIFFSNGSHLGYLYREEFLNNFKSQIKLSQDR